MLRTVFQWARRAYGDTKRSIGYVLFDRPAGIETTKIVRLRDIGLHGHSRVDYEPSPWRTLGRMLPKGAVSEDDVFIDFGCGKGRVVLQAATYPFRKVIGVELSTELLEVARSNVERSVSKHCCRNIELVNTDVLHYEIPDDVTIAYFFNPFEGEVFSAVIDKLVASQQRRPRPLRIIYMNPVEEDVLLRAGATLIKSTYGLRPTKEWARENSVRLYMLQSPTARALTAPAK